ncbi:MAG: class I SAM-dependent methyltransferase [Phycisphaerales bacterium]|nr:MAG: class I SAM-dependent methyltransferase [Phycisphaerales bacterium]
MFGRLRKLARHVPGGNWIGWFLFRQKGHGTAGIRQVGHRTYVGGMWEEIGCLQFDFLISQGLKPHHYFLDIACGSLRGGVHFIPYLERGHYLGIDKEQRLIEAGVEEELNPELLNTKQPQLIVSSEFEFDRFRARPDFALAQSLFTHLPPTYIEKCLRNLRTVVLPGCLFFATFFETQQPRKNPKRPHDHSAFFYTRGQMEAFGRLHAWNPYYIGDWDHPRRQVMVKYVAD